MKYEVKPIDYQDCKEWFLKKHYARRIPSVSFCFGLYSDKLEGVCSFGKPASPNLCIGVCGENNSDKVFELNRLIVNEGLSKNSLSFFVAECLKKLPLNLVIVSYADTAQGHHGYIYQATNWIYTGATKERTDIGNEDGTHSRHYDKSTTERKFRSSKHRYVFFVGNKTQKQKLKQALRYEQQPYPKGDNKRYDASYQPTTQIKLL